MVDWIEDHAHTRYRIGGQVRTLDAEGIAAACFRQHTSRALDPQLHTHVVIANRVVADDGRWLALDARTIKLRPADAVRPLPRQPSGRADPVPRGGVGRAGQRHRRDERRPRRRAGRVLLPHQGGGGADRGQARALRRVLRARSHAAGAVAAGAGGRHREPAGQVPRRRRRSLHAEWAERATAIGHDPEYVIGAAVSQPTAGRAMDEATVELIVSRAIAALTETQSTWRPAELVRELAAAVPTDVALDAEILVPWLHQLGEAVIAERLVDISRPIPDGVALRRDGRPITESVADRALTTPEILAQEERLIAWAERRLAVAGGDVALDASEMSLALSKPQLEVAGAVAGNRELVLVVGPAGTGKTSAVAPAVEQLRADGRAVFGVAPSAGAAEVLATDAGLASDTLDKLLVEHRLDRPPDHRYDLPPGATVVVDEAAMVSTPKLAELADLADARGWRMALVGDPLQFSAVGRSGMFGHLINCYGAIELDRVHRFANEWERDASLALRRGDTEILHLYDHHGRLHGGTARQMEEAVVDAWWQARARGESVAMMAPTNETVVELNLRAQDLRAEAGEIDIFGPSVSVGDYQFFRGDVVATRRNDRELHTDRGLMVKNRDQWEITDVHRGDVTVSGRTGTVRLPADYVVEHLELAYAQTSHANQGRTVDRSLLFLDGPTDTRGVYVPMTRGRQSNEVFVALQGEQTAVDVVGQALVRDWIDEPAVARRAELQRREPDGDGRGLGDQLDGAQLRKLLGAGARDHPLADEGGGRYRKVQRTTRPEQSAPRRAGRAPGRGRAHAGQVRGGSGSLRPAPAAASAPLGDLAGPGESEPGGRPHRGLALPRWRSWTRTGPNLRRGWRERRRLYESAPASTGSVTASVESSTVISPPECQAWSPTRPTTSPTASAPGPNMAPPPTCGMRRRPVSTSTTLHSTFRAAASLGHSRGWDDTAFDASQRAASKACESLDRTVGRVHAIEPLGLELSL